MDATRHARAKELFEAALPLGAAERTAFLARQCKDDTGLGREVADLLRHHEAAPEFLTGRAGASAAPAERPMPKLEVPGYRIERELGRGGMGVVYLAEQERPRRAVALKFLRLDSLGPAEVLRFNREGDILGRLSHPGIAHVYGVGLARTEQGELPWIAMEFVRGVPLREYVAAHAVDLRGLVELFTQLCDAIEHAHQKSIVHRDLKPSNVLVDEHGQVRVLDFGVARLIGDSNADGALRTRTGQMVGTLAYASPEQATGRVGAVKAPSDVYSLAVMLHELLTDELPYTIDETKVLEAIQTICDEEPQRLRKLRRDAPADLETVLLKALEKQPARRYATAGELATDLRRFLANQPVMAQAPTRLYQAQKFARRNRALMLSATTVIFALLVTVGVLLVGMRHDREQFERMRSMLDLMAREVFQLVPELGFGEDHRGSLEALDTRLAEELAFEPADPALRGYRARSLYELGALDQTTGNVTAAQRRFEEARVLRAGLVAENPADLESRTHLSQIYARLGEVARLHDDPAGELAWFQRAFELDQTLVREHPGDGELVEDLGWSLERMTDLALRRGDPVEAERLASRRLADATRLTQQEPDNWKFLYNAAQANYLYVSVAEHQASGAIAEHRREILRLARRLHELQPRRAVFQRLWAGANHGEAARALDAGRGQEALAYAEAAFGLGLQLVVSDPRSLGYTDFLRAACSTLFQAQLALGLHEQAVATLARLRVGATIVGEESPGGLLLLATAEHIGSGMHPTQESRADAWERTVQRYQTLLLCAEAGPEVFERVATTVRDTPEMAAELRLRLLAIDARVGRKFSELLGALPGDQPELAAGEAIDDR